MNDSRSPAEGADQAVLGAQTAAAYERLAAVLRQAPRTDAAWSEFAAAAQASGMQQDAIALCMRTLDAHPSYAPPLSALLHLTPDTPPVRNTGRMEHALPRFPISIVTCSSDDAQFLRVAASYDRALRDWPHEIVRIADATSVADGYTRALRRASGEVVVFTHDDIDILIPDLGARLARHLRDSDLVGVAGATRATAPAWAFAGWPHLHGLVIYPDGPGYSVTVYSRTVPLARGIRVMDGVFLAMPRQVATSVGWDAETCDGFHGYDVDFTLRAAQAGLRLGVASDLGVVHRSHGSFDEDWAAAARKLAAKHPELNGVRGHEMGYVARRVPDAAHARDLVDNWVRLNATPASPEDRARE